MGCSDSRSRSKVRSWLGAGQELVRSYSGAACKSLGRMNGYARVYVKDVERLVANPQTVVPVLSAPIDTFSPSIPALKLHHALVLVRGETPSSRCRPPVPRQTDPAHRIYQR